MVSSSTERKSNKNSDSPVLQFFSNHFLIIFYRSSEKASMDWDIPIGRLVVFQEELEAEPVSIGITVHPWVARCIRMPPWIGFMGAWCLLGEACLLSAALSNRNDWLAYKAFRGLIWTGGGVLANLVVAGSVQKICVFSKGYFRETQDLFSRTCQATCCCITWCQE